MREIGLIALGKNAFLQKRINTFMVYFGVLGFCGILAIAVIMLSLSFSPTFVMSTSALLISILNLAEGRGISWLGIRRGDFWDSVRAQLPFTAIGAFFLLSYAAVSASSIELPNSSFFGYWLISVPLQEFIFRGYGQGILRELFPGVQSVLFVSFVFALLHIFSGTQGVFPLVFALTFVAGLSWGISYEKHRNLAGPVMSHMILGTLLFLII